MQEQVRRTFAGDRSFAPVAERAPIESMKQFFAGAEQHRPKRQMQFIDVSGGEELPDVATPPPIRTFRPAAASRGWRRADSMPSVT
jgi:hypothetical protein